MAGFLYFLPGIQPHQLAHEGQVIQSIIKSRGLDDVLGDVKTTDRLAINAHGDGPCKMPGSVLCPLPAGGGVPYRIMYDPTHQDWQPRGDATKCWIGVDRNDYPCPLDLVRPVTYPGHRTELPDDEVWQIPIIRRPDGSTELRRDVIFDQGDWYTRIAGEFSDLFDEFSERAFGLIEARAAGRTIRVGADLLSLAVRALGINYRFGGYENNITKTIDGEGWETVIWSAIDGPTYDAAIKKKESAPSG